MKQTPKRIWLKEDREDPDYIVWGNDQPANHDDGVEYIRADLVQRQLTSATHSDGEGDAVYCGGCGFTHKPGKCPDGLNGRR